MSEHPNEPREAPEPAVGQIGEAGQVDQVGQVGPVEFTAPATPTAGSPAAAPPGKNPALRRRIATVAGSVLLAGAVVAGVGGTAVVVNAADRDAGDTVWKFPKPTADAGKEPTAEGLAGLLVPYGTDGWVRGPDLGAYGSDAQLSGAQATALRKESLSDLPRTQRKKLEKQIDRQKLTGMAMRSYLSQQPHALDKNDGIYTVSIVLAQMESRAAVKNISTFQQEFLDALDVFRKGPEIKGHKNAECFLPPKDADTDLDSVFCSAYQGDVLVTATADGVKPIDAKGVAMLLSEQLDRISEPGEAV
ncbi:hypothetical protein [Streptomyces sp. YU58]|uniref:hypothetical protein n=1 Tax=Streptomyces sp. SX92 TaxID=3158972 RepID=UPI0027BAA05C|nr:hypothetical protein [Streptomyces coralus]WLW54012.1 hypothetical protein QU709_22835 [Streptomyces coralus]